MLSGKIPPGPPIAKGACERLRLLGVGIITLGMQAVMSLAATLFPLSALWGPRMRYSAAFVVVMLNHDRFHRRE